MIRYALSYIIIYIHNKEGQNMDKLSVPKIGMRNIKTGVSVFICLLLFEIFNRENAFYACIAAVICMQSTVDNTKKLGLNRIGGTILGGLFGLLFLLIGNNIFVTDMFLFLIPIGIIIIIETCLILNKPAAISISCVVFLSLLTTHKVGDDQVMYAFNRVIDTSIGIVVTFIVNSYLKAPVREKKTSTVAKKEMNLKNNI